MLPGKDGFVVASELRRGGQYVPILILTARGRADDVLRGFESGADDYLPKPFELSILIARLNGFSGAGGGTSRRRRPPTPTATAHPTRLPSPAAPSTSPP